MSNKSDLGSAARSSSSSGREYICPFCPNNKTFRSSQALAGHSNSHRYRQSDDIDGTVNPAFVAPDDSKRPLSPSPLNYIRPDDESLTVRNFKDLENSAAAYEAHVASFTRGSGFGPFLDQAGGSRSGGSPSAGENPEKQELDLNLSLSSEGCSSSTGENPKKKELDLNLSLSLGYADE